MQTHPNMVLLAEEVRAKRWSLQDIVREISDVVQARSEKGKNFGTIVVSQPAEGEQGEGRERETEGREGGLVWCQTDAEGIGKHDGKGREGKGGVVEIYNVKWRWGYVGLVMGMYPPTIQMSSFVTWCCSSVTTLGVRHGSPYLLP